MFVNFYYSIVICQFNLSIIYFVRNKYSLACWLAGWLLYLTYLLTHSLTHSLSPSLPPSLTHSLTYLSAEDHIGHLFVVDIKFNEEKANEKNLLFNKIYNPTFEKVLPASQRSTFHLLDAMRLKDKGLLNSFKTTAKIHSTTEKEYLISLPHMHFLVKRCNWLVTRIYSDYNFEQSKFKKAFVVMNYVS